MQCKVMSSHIMSRAVMQCNETNVIKRMSVDLASIPVSMTEGTG